MNKNIFIDNLKKLDPDQINAFRKYLRSKQQDKKSLLVKLFDYLRSLWPEFHKQDIQKGTIHKILYGKKDAIVESRITNLLYRLSLVMENFLFENEIGINEFLKHEILATAYKRFGLYKSSHGEIVKMMELINEEALLSPLYYYNVYNTNQSLYFHVNTDKKIPDHHLLKDSAEALDKFYVLTKLKLVTEGAFRKRLFKEGIELPLITECIALAKKYSNMGYPIFDLYASLAELHLNETDNLLFQLTIEKFKKYLTILDSKEQRDIYLHLVNRGSAAYNEGNFKFGKLLLSLLKIGTTYGFHLEGSRISSTSYINISVVGSAQGDSKWASEFIQRYKPYLTENEKEDTEKLALAFWYFHQKDFDLTLKMLSANQGMDQQGIGLRGEALRIRTLYELIKEDYTYLDLAQKACIRFENRLQKMESQGITKVLSYFHFISILKKFIRIHSRRGNVTKNFWIKLEREMQESRPIANIEWIYKNCAKLNKKGNH